MVYIYEQTSGSLVTLTGAAEPFMTQEDDDDDIFTPIRTQSGYIRVIDETNGGNLLETIIPSNNVEKLVRVYAGEWNIDMTTFTDQDLLWQGFMCANAYTQPWDNQKKMIEFPVKSLLAAMEDISLPLSYAGDEINIAKVFVDAYEQLQENPSGACVISNLKNAETDFLKVHVEMAAFFKEEEVSNEGESHVEYVADSYYDAISAIAKLYGMTVREHYGKLYISMFDNGDGKIGRMQIPSWSNMVSIANGGTFGGSMIGVPETPLLEYVDFGGNDNVAGFVLGGKNAKVVVNIGGLTFGVSVPQTAETSDTPIEFALHTGKLYVQPHAPRYGGDPLEDWDYREYSRSTYLNYSNYETMLTKTLIKGYTSNPYASANTHLYTGIFPIRWFWQEDNEQVVLKSGLYMNTQYKTSATSPSNIEFSILYNISSQLKLNATSGWIRIDFEWHNIIWYSGMSEPPYYLFDDASEVFTEQAAAQRDVWAEVTVILSCGNKYWNGSAWVEYYSAQQALAEHAYFTIFITNTKINTNKTSDMNIDEDDGYFIPVTKKLRGTVTMFILNFVPVKTSDSIYRYCYSHILNNLEVSHVLPTSIVASQRGSNTYAKTILAKGFSEDKVVDISIGTINNNLPASCFIKRAIDTYIESLTYYGEGGTTYSMRPELNLLNRIVAQFNQIRRTFIAVMKRTYSAIQTYDFFQLRFTYSGRKFFGVVKEHNWREDIQEVKFIEVT